MVIDLLLGFFSDLIIVKKAVTEMLFGFFFFIHT